MCGIAGFHVKDPKVIVKHKAIETFTDSLLEGIEHRGLHATGFVSVGFDGKVTIQKEDVKATEFIKDRDRIPEGVRTVLLHTRHATLGSPTQQENNHPVIYGTCFAVHNGHINNHSEVFKTIDLKRSAEVDSQSIAAAAFYDGLGDIKVALERLEGGMATAIIDPVKNPGELILAKGKNSPLYIINAEKFLVFASTKDTILKAWAKVLGTPPSGSKIEELKDGTIILINDRNVDRATFTPKTKVFVPTTGFTPAQRTNGRTTGKTTPPAVSMADDNAVIRAKDEIAKFLKASNGNARNWKAHQEDEYTEEDFADALTGREWHVCYGCDRAILAQDLRATLQWGTICLDCKSVTTRVLADNYATTPDHAFDTCAGTTIPRISEINRDSLEVWSQHELTLHRDVLAQISKDCGSYYSPQVIEFLTVLVPDSYLQSAGVGVRTLIGELRAAYDETAAQLLEGDRIPDLGAGGSPQTWGFCDTHNCPYLEADGCEICTAEDRLTEQARAAILADTSGVDAEQAVVEGSACGVEPFAEGGFTEPTIQQPFERPVTGGELVVLPKCPKCGTHVLTKNGTCAVCDHLESNGTGANDGTHEDTTKRCITCGNLGVSYAVELAHNTSYYCASDFTICTSLVKLEDGAFEVCKKKTGHVLVSGRRVCHNHVRKQSKAMSDTTLRRRGGIIKELT